uniref:RRM domain-containing protein n=1 Tax=Caenorhabditis japonica TaxID=281687 RepID=A0A8R1IHF1_CAEJA
SELIFDGDLIILQFSALLIRGLPDGVNNTAIFDSLATLVCLNSIAMAKVSESKRFAYLQMKSTDEAKMLLNLTYKSPLRIKNKDLQVSWCKDSMSRLIQQHMTMLTGSTRENQTQGGTKTGAEIAAAAISKANAVRQASHQVGQLMTTGPVGPSIPPNFNVPPPNLSAPPPNMLPIIQQQQPEHQNGVIGVSETPHGLLPRY